MKAWIIRVASLYAFTVVALLIIGAMLPQVRVGIAALWGGVVMTIATIWIKPVVSWVFRTIAARAKQPESKLAHKLVEYLCVYGVALVAWMIIVGFSGVSAHGIFGGYLVPALAVLVAWFIYDLTDDQLEKHAGELYERARTQRAAAASTTSPTNANAPQGASTAPSPAEQSSREAARRELRDGLTDEQRRLFDELG